MVNLNVRNTNIFTLQASNELKSEYYGVNFELLMVLYKHEFYSIEENSDSFIYTFYTV